LRIELPDSPQVPAGLILRKDDPPPGGILARAAQEHPMPQTPYDMLGGETGVRALANAFYDAMETRADAGDIRRMHRDDLADIRQKLFEYLSGWLGGPHLYRQKYGGICLTRPHAPFAIGEVERDQWLRCMEQALEEVGAPEGLRQAAREPFFRIAETVRNRR
jgi:hemoglobin